ncbi:methyltransferase domain-containing protein [Candidatus Dependentiae bacterium]|nr:methyltransferase domain-containing protein [Candidatus Dependentiae bacterium]
MNKINVGKVVKKAKKNNFVGQSLGPISDLEKHLPSDWWKKIFNSLYLKTDGDVVENSMNTVKEVDILLEKTNVKPSDVILDLCCGQGRHSLELAKRGFCNVYGIDRSRYLIRMARKRAKAFADNIVMPKFSEGDARRINLEECSQDLVMLMGNSFGYFEKKEDDKALIGQIKRVLKSEGKLFLDIVDGEWMRSNFEPRSWEWIDQDHLVCRERSLAKKDSRIITREVIVNSSRGIIADQFYAERLYTYAEIFSLLESVGFEQISNQGNFLSDSTRKQDLGMMENRLIITAFAPKKASVEKVVDVFKVAVVLGDESLPDEVKRDGKFNDEDLNTISTFKDALKNIEKFDFTCVSNHKTLLKSLMNDPPSFVFNLCDEGYYNDAFKELHIPAYLDMLGIPYTGAGPACLAMCYNKSLVRALAFQLEIPVPLETYVDSSDQVAHLPSIFPALIKPNFGDSSLGITKDAVVNNAESLISYLEEMRKIIPGRPMLIQEYLSGAEYSVAIIGNPGNYTVFPILEVDYSGLPSNLAPILSYESKWLPDSPYWSDISYKKANISESISRQLIDHSILLFERLECRDYARFDFRENSKKKICLMEVNPNPGWCWDGKMNIMAGFYGLDYSEFLKLVLEAAKKRIGIR